jgi:hypothetical protein
MQESSEIGRHFLISVAIPFFGISFIMAVLNVLVRCPLANTVLAYLKRGNIENIQRESLILYESFNTLCFAYSIWQVDGGGASSEDSTKACSFQFVLYFHAGHYHFFLCDQWTNLKIPLDLKISTYLF